MSSSEEDKSILSEEDKSVLSSANVIMARHRKKKWRHRFLFSGGSSKKLKKSKTKSQSVGCLIESTTGSLFGNIDSFHGSWANLDSVSVTSNMSDDSRSLDSEDTCSVDRLHVPVQYYNASGILHSSQESLLSTDDDKSVRTILNKSILSILVNSYAPSR